MAEKLKVLRVVAKREGFRRAGYVFGSEAQDLPLQTLDPTARAAIERDRMLVATEVEIDAPSKAPSKAPSEEAGEVDPPRTGDEADAKPSARAASKPKGK